MVTLGARLRFARKYKGFTQEALAHKIGVSRGVIYNIEKDKTPAQAIVLNTICQTLKINRAWLTNGLGDMIEKNEVAKSTRILSELYEIAKGLSEDEQLYLLDVTKALKARLHGKSAIR